MSTAIVSRHDDSCKDFDLDLSSALDQANAREQQHDEEAILHFMQWRYHLQEASTARAERRALEADIWAERRAA